MIDMAAGRAAITFRHLNLWSDEAVAIAPGDFADVAGRFYLRFNVEDRPSVLAEIATILGRRKHLDRLGHPARSGRRSGVVPLVVMTHKTTEGATNRAIETIDRCLSCAPAACGCASTNSRGRLPRLPRAGKKELLRSLPSSIEVTTAMSATIVIFGASGDLTSRKLVPALYELARKNRLPADTRIIGFSPDRLQRRPLACRAGQNDGRIRRAKLRRRPVEQVRPADLLPAGRHQPRARLRGAWPPG